MEALNKEQALLLSAYTGVLLCDDFSDLHQYIEKIAGRPVFTHEIDRNTEFMKELQEKLKPQVLGIIYKSKE